MVLGLSHVGYTCSEHKLWPIGRRAIAVNDVLRVRHRSFACHNVTWRPATAGGTRQIPAGSICFWATVYIFSVTQRYGRVS